MTTDGSSGAHTVATLLSELDHAISIHAQVAQDQQSQSSENSAHALQQLRNELAQQTATHGSEAVDLARITKLSPGIVLPGWVPQSIASVIGSTSADEPISNLVREAIQENNIGNITRLTNAVSRSISPSVAHSRSDHRPEAPPLGQIFSMRTGSSSTVSRRRRADIANKKAELAAAREARLEAEVAAMEAEESLGGSRVTDASRDELAERLQLIGLESRSYDQDVRPDAHLAEQIEECNYMPGQTADNAVQGASPIDANTATLSPARQPEPTTQQQQQQLYQPSASMPEVHQDPTMACPVAPG